MMRATVAIVCVAAFSALCRDAVSRLAPLHPTMKMCAADPGRYTGSEIWLTPSPVLESDPASFVVQYYESRVRVHSTLSPAVGHYVQVQGTFRTDGGLDAITWKEEAGFDLKRKGVVLVSLAVLAAAVVVFRRTFAWRDGAIHVR